MKKPSDANALYPYLTIRDLWGSAFGSFEGRSEACRSCARAPGVCSVRLRALGSVLGSAVLSSLEDVGAEGHWKVRALGRIGRLMCDAMLARVWPAIARGIESMAESRSQRIGRV